VPKYAVFFRPSADRALRKLPKEIQRRIVIAVNDLQDDPRPSSTIKMQGADDLWRIRVGDYRLVYTIKDRDLLVLVLRIGHRRDVYR
jgi:mRNA interferase RelE/StbE